jgi:hypothetical protein
MYLAPLRLWVLFAGVLMGIWFLANHHVSAASIFWLLTIVGWWYTRRQRKRQ